MNRYDIPDDPDREFEEQARTWTTYAIYTGQHAVRGNTVLVHWSSNDDNDDGYPDDDIEHAEYRFPNVEAAIKFTGRTRRGLYGQPVDVTLDGEVLR